MSDGAAVASLYNVLKVSPDAPAEVIRAAYRVLASRHHPDRAAGDADALSRMQRINEAYRVLSDPDLRAEHDAALRNQRRRRASDGTGDPSARTRPVAPSASSSSVALRQRAAATYAAHGPSEIRVRVE